MGGCYIPPLLLLLLSLCSSLAVFRPTLVFWIISLRGVHSNESPRLSWPTLMDGPARPGPSLFHLMGRGPARPDPSNFQRIGRGPGMAPARRGPSYFERMGRGPAEPIHFSKGGPRPDPAHHILFFSPSDPARPGTAHQLFKSLGLARPGAAHPIFSRSSYVSGGAYL